MKTIKYFGAIILISILSWNCADENLPTADKLYTSGAEAANIISISPSLGLSGVTVFDITAENLDDSASNHWVYFNNKKGTVISKDGNVLKAKAPILTGDSIEVKIVKLNSDKISNKKIVKLVSALKTYDYEKVVKLVGGLTVDQSDSIYFTKFLNDLAIGTYKLSKNGDRLFAPKGQEPFWTGMKYCSKDQTIYACRNREGIWKVIEGQTPSNSPWRIYNSGDNMLDLDFDNNDYIWSAGSTTKIYKVKRTDINDFKSFTLPFTGSIIRGIRYFNGALYFGGTIVGKERVYKVPVLSNGDLDLDNLEQMAVISDIRSCLVKAITLDNEGNIYVGTDLADDPIYIIYPDKRVEVFYPGVLKGKVLGFAWDSETNLIYARERLNDKETNIIVKVNTLKQGAPNYALSN
jgi:hypothetical protein